MIGDHLAYHDAVPDMKLGSVRSIDLRELIDEVGDILNSNGDQAFNVNISERTPYVFGDPYQLGFVFESLFAYLLRNLPEDEIIRCNINIDNKLVTVTIDAVFPSKLVSPSVTSEVDVARIRRDVALSEDYLKQIIANHQGIFQSPEYTENLFIAPFKWRLVVMEILSCSSVMRLSINSR